QESWLVRGVARVYRPVLSWFLDRPGGIVWVVAATFLVGFAVAGERYLLLGILGLALLAGLPLVRERRHRVGFAAGLILVALLAEQNMTPPGRDVMVRLDEGMTMDMPITVPGASITQSTDDLKARDMILCRFPEVKMVVGKAGRAETPADPAPLDMIETMVEFRPKEQWPKRKLRPGDAQTYAAAILDALIRRGIIAAPADRAAVVAEVAAGALARFDVHIREVAYQQNRAFERQLGARLTRFTVGRLTAHRPDLALNVADLQALDVHAQHLAMSATLEDVTALADDAAARMVRRGAIRSPEELLPRQTWLDDGAGAVRQMLGASPRFPLSRLRDEVQAEYDRLWQLHIEKLNGELRERAAPMFARMSMEEVLARGPINDPGLAARWHAIEQFRLHPPTIDRSPDHHHGAPAAPPDLDPVPELDAVQDEPSRSIARGLLLWLKDRSDLVGFGGELDRAVQMPGWTNVWTMPIQNRVDMLASGVNTDVGVRVLGRDLDDVV